MKIYRDDCERVWGGSSAALKFQKSHEKCFLSRSVIHSVVCVRTWEAAHERFCSSIKPQHEGTLLVHFFFRGCVCVCVGVLRACGAQVSPTHSHSSMSQRGCIPTSSRSSTRTYAHALSHDSLSYTLHVWTDVLFLLPFSSHANLCWTVFIIIQQGLTVGVTQT